MRRRPDSCLFCTNISLAPRDSSSTDSSSALRLLRRVDSETSNGMNRSGGAVFWKDLLIAQGHDLDTIELTFPNLKYREPILLLRNTGHGFVDVSPESGAVFQQAWVARGLATGDIDNDGKVDVVVSTNDGPIYILHNETPTAGHYLTLKLTGHRSNRDAIGAEVKITTPHGTQLATVSTASSYLSSSDKRIHFGLGADIEVTMEVRWPSGIVQTLKGVRADQIVTVDEPVEASAPSGAGGPNK